MGDVPGLKSLSFLSQQPVTLLKPLIASGHRLEMSYWLSLTFEDDGSVNIAVSKKLHDLVLARIMAQAGVAAESRVVAQSQVTSAGDAKPVVQEPLPLDASGEDVYKALVRVAGEKPDRGGG